jgi:putative nucleotidyltransferase with HDIG domain
MAEITLAQLEAEALAAVNALGVPPCPQVLSKIGRELKCEAPDVRKIAELIAQDATCSAVILHTASSLRSEPGRKARSVQQAIANLGSSHASYLLASLLLRNAFPSSGKNALLRFWDTAMQLALCAAHIAGELGGVERDEAHTYALLRDVGSAVLICKFDDYDEATAAANAQSAPNIAAAEKARFGTDHTLIGAKLARDCGLPEEMIEAILRHHADGILDGKERATGESLRLIAIGALSDRIVDDYEGTAANDATIRLTARALRVLNLSAADFEDLQDEASDLLDQLDINAMPTIRVHRFDRERDPGA